MKSEELIIPERISVFEDKKTSARTIALPFQLPDGINCVLIISRLNRSPWKPEKDIDKIVIYYKDNA